MIIYSKPLTHLEDITNTFMNAMDNKNRNLIDKYPTITVKYVSIH